MNNLRLKQSFEIDGSPRVNILEGFVTSHGSVRLKISNGRSKKDVEKYGHFPLSMEQAKKLIVWLQENTK